MKQYCYIFILSILLFSTIQLYSQSRNELESQKQKTQKEIEYTNKLLQETRKSSKESENKLLLLNKQIKLRKRLIANIQDEIKQIENKILRNNSSINKLQTNLDRKRNEYKKLIYIAYKNRNTYTKLIYVFASNDFNQAYRRMKYLQQYAEYRKKQFDQIISTQNKLNNTNIELSKQKAEKQKLIESEIEQTTILASDQKEQSRLLNSLKSKEKELKQKLKEQQLISQKLQKAIEQIIAEETRKAALRNKKSTTTTVYELTPEEKIISDKFEANKGRLPWPTERGIITSTFGEHEHPALAGIKIRNNGIDISTTEGASVRAIFDGVVSKVITIPGANKAIIIRHGEYLTVYSNLINVNVDSGDKVKAKQVIGTVYTDLEDGNKSSVHIEIWKENVKLDPALWISQK